MEELKIPKKVATAFQDVVETEYKTSDGRVFKDRAEAQAWEDFVTAFQLTYKDEQGLDNLAGDWYVMKRFWLDAYTRERLSAYMNAQHWHLNIGKARVDKSDMREIMKSQEDGWHYMVLRECGDAVYTRVVGPAAMMAWLDEIVAEKLKDLEDFKSKRDSYKERHKL